MAKIHGCAYNASKDSFNFDETGEEASYEGFEIDTTEGVKKVYPIGSGAWAWDEDEWVED